MRPIATTASATLSANGDEVADIITYNGAITQALDNSFVLSGAAAREGYITGGITQSGAAADLTVNGGTWTLCGASSTIADDVVVTGTTAILNLNTAGVIAFGASTGKLLQITNGATVNLGASGTLTGFADTGIYIAQSAGGAEAILNMNGFNQTFFRLILGERLADRSGTINGSGTLTIDGATGIELYRGTINANLASTAASPFNISGPGIVTLAREAVRGGRLDDAERLFERVLARDGRNIGALTGLTELYFNRGAYARALGFGERSVAIAPDDAALRVLVGDAAFKAFRYDVARGSYEQAQKLGHPEAERRLAKLAAKLAD